MWHGPAIQDQLTDAQLRASAVPVSEADGANVAIGATTDAAVSTDTTGTISGKLRGIVKILADVWDSTWDALRVELADGPQLDSFGRLRVSQPKTLFDSQQEYGLCTVRCWDAVCYDASGPTTGYSVTNPSANGGAVAGGNLVGPRDANTRMTPITVTADDGDYSILQSRQYTRYIPGKGQLIFVTGVFATGSGATAKIVRRTSTSGSAVDNEVAQASWNIDPMNGSGPSGITIDFTKTQILVIQAQWLGVGRVIVGFDVDGVIYPAHAFNNANSLTVPYTQAFNLPVRLEARTSAGATDARVGYFDHANGIFLRTTRATPGGSIQFVCCSVQSEGGDEMRGFPRTAYNAIAGTTITGTRIPVLSVRPAATMSGITNRAHIEQDDILLLAATNSVRWEVIIGGTLTGAAWLRVGDPITAGAFVVGIRYNIISIGTTDFTLIGASANTVGVSFVATGAGTGTGTAVIETSCAEYDTTATAVTGGIVVASGFIAAGSGGGRALSSTEPDLRNPLTISQIDSLAVTQPSITLCCTKFTGANPVVNAVMNWHEQIV